MSEPVTEAGNHASKVHAFLAAISEMPSITAASKAAGIQRGLHYRRYKNDPVYKAAFDQAWELGVEALEDHAVEKATVGYREPLVYKGSLVYESYEPKTGKGIGEPISINRPNAALLMFMLRGAKPEKYRERYRLDQTITFKIADRLTAARQRLRKKTDDDGDSGIPA